MSQFKTRVTLQKRESDKRTFPQPNSSVKARREERKEKEAGNLITSSALKRNIELNSTPPTSTITPPTFRTPPHAEPSFDPELRPFLLSTHCDALFTSLRGLKGDGLLMDCSLNLLGHAHKAHILVLAAVCQTAEAWLSAGEAGLREVSLDGGTVTPAGLEAVLDFCYTGEIHRGETEELLDACRGLRAERLLRLCGGDSGSFSAREERERSLQLIRALWERNVGCDVIIQSDSADCFPGNYNITFVYNVLRSNKKENNNNSS